MKKNSKIAVITPYFNESEEYLIKCHQSVQKQAGHPDHFMVSDGLPNSAVNNWNVRHFILPSSHGDYGNTARALGSLLAISEGYEFVAFLDADNWYHEDHIASLMSLIKERQLDLASSFRTFHDAEGAILENSFDLDENEGTHIDTSCFLFSEASFPALKIWLDMPKILSPIGDRIFYKGLTHLRMRTLSTRRRTVAYRTTYAFHYQQAGLSPPLGSKSGTGTEAIKWLRTLEGVRVCVSRLGFYPL